MLGIGSKSRAEETLRGAFIFPQNESPSVAFRQQIQAGTTLIEAVSVDLTPDKLAPDNHLFLFAYEVRIKGKIRLNGKNVFIHACKVVVEPDAEIDVSGAVPTPPFTGRAQDGQGAGANGSPGVDGTRGMDSGYVQIVAEQFSGSTLKLVCRGSGGSDGQPGGNGAVGGAGGAGGKNQDGGRGGKGGDGGNGGKGGDGGTMGLAMVNIINAQGRPVTFDFAAGQGGKGGAGGESAKGGPGGAGGPKYEEYERHYRDRF